VPARRRDFQPPLRVFLSAHLREVRRALIHGVGVYLARWLRRDALRVNQMLHEADERIHAIDRHPRHKRRFRRVLRRHDHDGKAICPRRVRHRERAVDVMHAAIERKFTDDEHLRHLGGGHIELLRGKQDTERDGQIIVCALLANICRGEVHGDAAHGKAPATVADRRTHALLGLLHGGVRQPDDHEPRHPRADVHFYGDRHAIQPDQGATRDLCEHSPPPPSLNTSACERPRV